MLEECPRELLEQTGELLTTHRGTVGAPLRDERIHLVGVLVDAVVLGLHRLHEPGGGRSSFEEQGPEELVLTGVVHVQPAEDEPQGIRDDSGPGGVTVRDAADQRGERDELAPEDAVDDEHLVDVGLLAGLGGGDHDDASRSGVGVSHQPRSVRGTAHPRHPHTTTTLGVGRLRARSSSGGSARSRRSRRTP